MIIATSILPLTATMISLTGTLARILKDKNKKYVVGNACIGGGQSIATIIRYFDG
jgi:acetyl-CoA acetyltransferase